MSQALSSFLKYLPGFRPDISFQKDDAYRFLPKIIALVMTMVAFMLFLAVSLGSTLQESSQAQSNTILIHVPAQDGQEEISQNLLKEMSALENVDQAELVSSKALGEQMKPWLGELEEMDKLPMPILVKIILKGDYSNEAFKAIAEKAKTIHESVIINAPAEWSENYSRFSSMIQWVLWLFSGALFAGLVGLMIFASTTAIKLHHRAVILLHSIGATDNYIAAQFQANAALLAIRGAVIGTVVAFILYGILGLYIDRFNAALLPELSLKWMHGYILLFLPIAAALVGFVSGRFASLNYLRRLM